MGYIRASDAGYPISTTTPFSVSMWFKPDFVYGSQALFFYGKRVGTTAFVIYLNNGRIFVYNPTLKISASGIQADHWYHLVFTYTGGSDTPSSHKIYLNNVLASTGQGSASNIELNGKLYIGWDGAVDLYNGNVKDVMTFNVALSEAQVTQLWGAGTPNPQPYQRYRTSFPFSGLVDWWPIGACDGTTVEDVQAPANNGEIIGTSEWEFDCPLNVDNDCPIYDTFSLSNRALNGAAPTKGPAGQVWSAATEWQIVSDHAEYQTPVIPPTGFVNATIESNISNAIQITVLITPQDDGIYGITFRRTDSSNEWLAFLTTSGPIVRIVEVTGGVQTIRATAATGPVVIGQSYLMTVTLDGPSMTASIAGGSVSYSSSIRQSATIHGMANFATTGTPGAPTAYFDNFSICNIVGTPTTTTTTTSTTTSTSTTSTSTTTTTTTSTTTTTTSPCEGATQIELATQAFGTADGTTQYWYFTAVSDGSYCFSIDNTGGGVASFDGALQSDCATPKALDRSCVVGSVSYYEYTFSTAETIYLVIDTNASGSYVLFMTEGACSQCD